MKTTSISEISELKEKILSFYCNSFDELLKGHNAKSYKQLISLWTDFHSTHIEAADSVLQKYTGSFTTDDNGIDIEKIEAQSVIVEVVDKNTGKMFRRNIPVKYLETDNGIIISGETSEGKPASIALLSDTALARINDLTGKGPDKPRCDH